MSPEKGVQRALCFRRVCLVGQRKLLVLTCPAEQAAVAGVESRAFTFATTCIWPLCGCAGHSIAQEFKPLFIMSSAGGSECLNSSVRVIYKVFQGIWIFIVFIYRDCSGSLIGPDFFYKAVGCRQFL